MTETDHNSVARLLRNGLAVVGFAALEDFIKTRTSEALGEIGKTGVPFQSLPERIQHAVTFEAVAAFSYQLSLRPKAERVTYAQEHALRVASTASTAYELTPHAFCWDQANLQDDAIKDVLKSFWVAEPWAEMTRIGSRLGLVALPLSETYKGAALRRHRAAHVAHADTPQTDLAQYVREALAIAIGFDVLLSKAVERIRAHDKKYLIGQSKVDASAVRVRQVRFVGGLWKELLEGRKAAVKTENDVSVLSPAARARAVMAKDLFVQFGPADEIILWECN
ncbi:MAG: hypothetical protein M3P06_21295 [Acidobacteriota bacterium]|nr:hypothetical protein [Acidobacteriota bacterium]